MHRQQGGDAIKVESWQGRSVGSGAGAEDEPVIGELRGRTALEVVEGDSLLLPVNGG